MASVKMRYVTQHRRGAKVYWYWQRRGFPLARLPDDEGERFAEQLKLNAVADGRMAPQDTQAAEESVAAVIRAYEDSDRYRDLAPGSRRMYDYHLRTILELYGNAAISKFDRTEVVKFIERIPGRSSRNTAAAVLSCLFFEAEYRGLVTHNPAQKLRLKGARRRDVLWTPEQCDAFMAACTDRDVRTYFILCRYTAQRPGDVARMTWRQYDAQTIELRQEKTGRLVAVPAHAELRAYLDDLDRDSIQISGGHTNRWLQDKSAQTRSRAGLKGLQTRDLRRTAMVQMAEAGAELQDISAVSGHSIEKTKTILETYIPRTRKMAARAINLWEESKQKV